MKRTRTMEVKTTAKLIIMVACMLLVGFSSCKTCQCPAYSQSTQKPSHSDVPSSALASANDLDSNHELTPTKTSYLPLENLYSTGNEY